MSTEEEREKERGRRLMSEWWISSRTNLLTIQSHTRTATGTQRADPQSVCLTCVFGECMLHSFCMCVLACLWVQQVSLCPAAVFCVFEGGLIVCCGVSVKRRSKAWKQSPRGERMLWILFVETENSNSEGASSQTLQKRGGVERRGKIPLDVIKSREQRCCDHLQKQCM